MLPKRGHPESAYLARSCRIAYCLHIGERVDLAKGMHSAPRFVAAHGVDLDLSGAWADESTFMAMGPGILRQITMARPDQIIEIPLRDVPTLDNGPPTYVFPVPSAVP
jgi:hypothetical protein